MKLEKAIEILEDYVKPTGFIPHKDFSDAIKLLIEAGKRIHVLRLISTNEANHLLPGETEE